MATPASRTVSISQLKPWAHNPRSVTKADFERLKKQIKKLGQYKPLVCCPNGKNKYIVLGGNMRLKAYRELGIKKLWISVVNAKIKKDRVEISLSDNDRVGFYDDQALANLIMPIYEDLDLTDFKIDLKIPNIDLEHIVGKHKGSLTIKVPETEPTEPHQKNSVLVMLTIPVDNFSEIEKELKKWERKYECRFEIA